MSIQPTLPRIVATLAVTAAFTACGQGDPGAGSSTTTTEPTPSASRGNESPQQITPGGLAVIVREHLGAQTVREFTTYEPEPGSVSVMVRLRGGGPADYFGVSVYSPDAGSDFDLAERCTAGGPRGDQRRISCRTLEDGTQLMTAEMAEGFSDDNTDGLVLYATVVPAAGGAAMAMYESYDDTPPVSVAELDELVADPRLRWLTEAAVNDAGADVEVRELDG